MFCHPTNGSVHTPNVSIGDGNSVSTMNRNTDVGVGLLGCDTMWTGSWVLTFWRNILPLIFMAEDEVIVFFQTGYQPTGPQDHRG
jgi:hypothetical protein